MDVNVICEGVMSVPFFDEDYCAKLVEKAEAVKNWDLAAAEWEKRSDKYKGKEIGVDRMGAGLEDSIARRFDRQMCPVVDEWYHVIIRRIYEPFVIRYEHDGITCMPLHHDLQGIVSGVVLLNSGYEGGHLTFPKQGVTNKDVPIGHMILFPANFSHEVTDVTAGKRYSMAFWTEGEIDASHLPAA